MTRDVDVIILSWNRVDDTIAAIQSALEQEGVSKAVQIVDQGSTPENLERIREVAARHPEVSLKELGGNVGVARGRNIATRMGSARIVVTLDNDAIFGDSQTLARVVRRFEGEPSLGALAFRIINYYTRQDDEMCWDYPRVPTSHANQEFLVTRFIGAGNAIRREAFIAAGEYDETLFFGGEERDLSYRMVNLGYRIKYVPDLTVLHRVDPEARVRWNDGRYYYLVRNGLYTDYKFGMPFWRLARAAAASVVKGAYNGLLTQALRAVLDATLMGIRFSRSNKRTSIYKLRKDARDYIDRCERRGEESVWIRVRRHFAKLPGSV
ncbi:MAG: glycosyltransferase family 2 protein [Gemmatimonas sp.]